MGDKKRRTPRVCGKCGWVSDKDLSRHYCPFAAAKIYANKPADSCKLFIDSDDDRQEDGRGRRKYVR